MSEKNILTSIAVIGHVDHGKSTLMGHFLFDIGAVDPRVMKKHEIDANGYGMSSWKWAYVLDAFPEEKEKGKTMDIAFRRFDINGRNFVLIDNPGHRDFTKNTIAGLSTADACILTISAGRGEIEAGLEPGNELTPSGQTLEHTLIASVLGIKDVIVVVNKMDSANYSEKRFIECKKILIDFLKKIQSPWIKELDNIPFIPLSGMEGDNLVNKSEKMAWYSGPTLKQAIEKISVPPDLSDKDLRLVIYDAYQEPGIGLVSYGRLISGKMEVNDRIVVAPGARKGTVKTIWDEEDEIQLASAGMDISFLIKGDAEEDLRRGAVVGHEGKEPSSKPRIQVRLLYLGLQPMVLGNISILHVGSDHVEAELESIIKVHRQNTRYKNTQREIEGKSIMIFTEEVASVVLQVKSPIVAEKQTDIPKLGRVILRKKGRVIAAAIVEDILDAEE
ncbi:MAG: elongation factor 1-alpha [Candidatus Heimdallarchaeota archaeon]|nr:elongation factor 1-alpha [Candidatus Heimdallarchaeota archaeon]